MKERTKRRVVLGTVLVSILMGVPHIMDNWVRLRDQGATFLLIYAVFGLIFACSGLALAGKLVRSRGSESATLPVASRNPSLVLLNGFGAAGMGMTAAVACVRLLPVTSWPVPVALCVVDVVHTVWSRRYLVNNEEPTISDTSAAATATQSATPTNAETVVNMEIGSSTSTQFSHQGPH